MAKKRGAASKRPKVTATHKATVAKDPDLHAPAPSAWYLYVVLFLNAFQFYIFMRIRMGLSLPHWYLDIAYYLDLFWVGLNVAMIWYLRKHKAKKSAYMLPVYFIALFMVLQAVAVILPGLLTAFDVQIDQSIQMIIFSVIVAVTTIFEVGAALISLKMRNTHAASL